METELTFCVVVYDYPQQRKGDRLFTMVTGLSQYDAIHYAQAREAEHHEIHRVRTKARSQRSNDFDIRAYAQQQGVTDFDWSPYNTKNRFRYVTFSVQVD